MDALVCNGQAVDAMRIALTHSSAMRDVPGMLRRVLAEDCWRDRVEERTGEHYQFRSFAEFLEAPPLEGMDTPPDLLRRMCHEDKVALDMLDQALQGKQGRPKTGEENPDNVRVSSPYGNGETTALRRLRRDAPKLHAQVLAGELSAHAAAIKAGFRRPTATFYVDSPEAAIAGLLRRFSLDELAAALDAA